MHFTDGAGCVLEERAGMVVDKFLPALIPFRIHTNGSPITELRVQALGRRYVSSFRVLSKLGPSRVQSIPQINRPNHISCSLPLTDTPQGLTHLSYTRPRFYFRCASLPHFVSPPGSSPPSCSSPSSCVLFPNTCSGGGLDLNIASSKACLAGESM